jgi:Bardet-Biedl syndrome 4 protein
MEALEFSPENPELLTTVGLLYLRLGENFRAFDFLGLARVLFRSVVIHPL